MSRLAGCLAVLAFASAPVALRAEPPSELTLALAATREVPRNSEGAFATLRDGRILFCYSQFTGGDSDFSFSRLAKIVSADEGRTWSRPVTLALPGDGAQEMSVSLLRLRSGKLALFSLIKHGRRECHPYLRLSNDEGEHWSAPRPLFSAPGYFILNNDRVIQTGNGRLIAPIAFHRPLSTGHSGHLDVDPRALDLWYCSDDEGATWKESPTWWTLPAVTEAGLQEPGVVELADGSLFSWARTDQGCQYACRSSDGGVSWTPPRPTLLRSPLSPAEIKRVPGRATLLAVYNDYSGQFPFHPTVNPYDGRSPLVAALSTDGARTWVRHKLLEGDPQRSFCYPAVHFIPGHVLIAYWVSRGTGEPSELRIRRVALSWLLAPESADERAAKAALRRIFSSEESWIKIHAAEALLAGGDALALRDRFLAWRATADSRPYRVGIWRVLAETSPTRRERDSCTAHVAGIFLDRAAPDRSQAIETLDKLGTVVTGPLRDEVRRVADTGSGSLRALCLWSLVLANEPDALIRLDALLSSPDPTLRVDAGYALRWLHPHDADTRRALARAADAEAIDSKAAPYLLGAAFRADAAPERRAAWKAALEHLVQSGSMDARFEACQALMPDVTLDELPRYRALLSDPGPDSQVAGAWTLLYVAARR